MPLPKAKVAGDDAGDAPNGEGAEAPAAKRGADGAGACPPPNNPAEGAAPLPKTNELEALVAAGSFAFGADWPNTNGDEAAPELVPLVS